MHKYFTMSLKDIEGLNMPPDDTLNVKNGMNYAQFLEALLRICMYKSELAEVKLPGAFKRVLEDVFKGDSKREDFKDNKMRDFDWEFRASQDPVLRAQYDYMLQRDGQDFFEYQDLLAAVFFKVTNPTSISFPEMSKLSFCKVLEDAKILKLPRVEEKKAAAKGKDAKKKDEEQKGTEEVKQQLEVLFRDEEVLEIIKPVRSFDENNLDYYNFLEALWRVAWHYPFSKEEQAEVPSMQAKLRWVLEKLDAQFRDSIKEYNSYLESRERSNPYQPRTVVADEDEEMSDEDDD